MEIYILFLARVVSRGLLARHYFYGFCWGFYPYRILEMFWLLLGRTDFSRSKNNRCFIVGWFRLELGKKHLRSARMLLGGDRGDEI